MDVHGVCKSRNLHFENISSDARQPLGPEESIVTERLAPEKKNRLRSLSLLPTNVESLAPFRSSSSAGPDIKTCQKAFDDCMTSSPATSSRPHQFPAKAKKI